MQLHLYPLKSDIAVFDAAHSSVFVNIAGFDNLVKRSFCLVIIYSNDSHFDHCLSQSYVYGYLLIVKYMLRGGGGVVRWRTTR